MCCRVLSAAGKGKEGIKTLLVPMATAGMLVPQQAVPHVHAVLMAVLGWQGCECLAMAEIELYSRYPVPHQISKLGKFATTSVSEQTWGQPMVQKANLPLAGRPFSLLWDQDQHSTCGSSLV